MSPAKRKPRIPEITKAAQNTVTFVVGLAGVVHQTLVERVDRPYLLALFGALLGVPLFFNRDDPNDDDEEAAP